jgi:hypothetical protein
MANGGVSLASHMGARQMDAEEKGFVGPRREVERARFLDRSPDGDYLLIQHGTRNGQTPALRIVSVEVHSGV